MTRSTSSIEPKIKQFTFESVLKGTGLLDNPALVAELKPVYDASRQQNFYPAETYHRVVEFAREHLFSAKSEKDAYIEIGQKAFYGYYKGTIVGRVALAALHIISPARLMSMTSRLWEDSGLGQCQTEKLTEQRYRVAFRNFAANPSIVTGLAREALTITGAKNLRYELNVLPSPGQYLYDFDLIWEWD